MKLIKQLFANKKHWHCAYCFGPLKQVGDDEFVHVNADDATVCGRPVPVRGWG